MCFFRSPPLALQPSLGRYFTRVNQEWRKGYEVQITRSGYFASDPLLSHVVVVSISGVIMITRYFCSQLMHCGNFVLFKLQFGLLGSIARTVFFSCIFGLNIH